MVEANLKQSIAKAQEATKQIVELPSLIISHKDKDGQGYRLSAAVKIVGKPLLIQTKENDIVQIMPGDVVLHVEQAGRCWTKEEALKLRDFITACFGD